jgi:hypothetical protein
MIYMLCWSGPSFKSVLNASIDHHLQKMVELLVNSSIVKAFGKALGDTKLRRSLSSWVGQTQALRPPNYLGGTILEAKPSQILTFYHRIEKKTGALERTWRVLFCSEISSLSGANFTEIKASRMRPWPLILYYCTCWPCWKGVALVKR